MKKGTADAVPFLWCYRSSLLIFRSHAVNDGLNQGFFDINIKTEQT